MQDVTGSKDTGYSYCIFGTGVGNITNKTIPMITICRGRGIRLSIVSLTWPINRRFTIRRLRLQRSVLRLFDAYKFEFGSWNIRTKKTEAVYGRFQLRPSSIKLIGGGSDAIFPLRAISSQVGLSSRTCVDILVVAWISNSILVVVV